MTERTQYSIEQLRTALAEVCAQRDVAQARLITQALELAHLREIVAEGAVAMTSPKGDAE